MNKHFNLLLICSTLAATRATTLLAGEGAAMPEYRPVSLSLEAGIASGLGGSVNVRFTRHLGLVGGVNYFEYSHNGEIKGVDYDAKLRFLTERVAVSIYPWSHRSFRINVGAIFDQNRFTGSARSTGGLITLNGNVYTTSQLGTLTLRYEQQPINPYVSIAGNYFYFDKAHHWSLGGELGVMYVGTPRLSVTQTGGSVNASADIQQYKNTLERDLKRVPVWPVLNIALTYAF